MGPTSRRGANRSGGSQSTGRGTGRALTRNCRLPAFALLLAQLPEPHRTMVGLIAATGLRVGELLALRWRSVDLALGTLRVSEAVYEGQFQLPKTQRARRTISLGPRAVREFREHRGRVSRTRTTTSSSAIARGSRCGSRSC